MSESLGIGIRVLVNRAWGFFATSDLSRESVERTAMDRVIDRNASNYNKNIDAGGEGGIRTHVRSVSPYNGLANVSSPSALIRNQ